jgi:hypothetical protein
MSIINGLDESDTGQVVLKRNQNGFLVSKQQSAGRTDHRGKYFASDNETLK